MSGEVLPLSASPCSRWGVSLKSRIRSVSNFRWALPWVHVVSPESGFDLVDNDILWLMFGNFPLVCTGFSIVTFLGDPHVYKITKFLYVILVLGGGFTHFLVFHSVQYWYRDMPFRLIGAKGRFMLEVIPVITLAALHHLLEFNYAYLTLVLGLTTYFYTIAYFMHAAYDIRGKDILLGVVVQVLAYILNGGLLVRGLGLSLCVGLCLCRYVMYCAPEVPTHHKKELERLPC